jgi:hypothetical protein
MAILTLPEAKDQLNIDEGDSRYDDELKTYLEALTSVVENELRQVVEQRDVVEYHDLYQAVQFVLRRVPAVDLSSVTKLSDSSVVDPSTLVLDDCGAVLLVSGQPLTGLYSVEYTAGPDVVPDNWKRAAGVILQHVWELQHGVGVVPAATVTTGDFMPARQFTGFTIPNRARELLGSPMPLLP